MIVSKGHYRACVAALAAVGVFFGLWVSQVKAGTLYFDNNGTLSGYGTSDNGGPYSWDGSVWATLTGGTNPTAPWVQGSFARFDATSPHYSVAVHNDEQMAGMYEHTSSVALTIADGGGSLDVASGDQGFLVSGSASSLILNCVVGGSGGVAPELSGSLFLYGNNTYSGGTKIGYNGATLTYFNNSHSFGTGPIVNLYGSTNSVAALLATGGSTVTIPNDFQVTVSGNGFHFAGNLDTPLISTGTWDTGAGNNVLIKNDGALLTISGKIIGSGGVTILTNSTNTVVLSGANTYTGTTFVNPGAILKLGAANTIASTSELDLNGGTLNPGNFVHVMGSTMLNIFSATTTTPATTIDASGGGKIQFSEATNTEGWDNGNFTGILNVIGPYGALQFGTDNQGLRSDQLSQIEFNSDSASLGTGWLTNDGYLVPEPSSLAFVLIGAPLLLRRRRRSA